MNLKNKSTIIQIQYIYIFQNKNLILLPMKNNVSHLICIQPYLTKQNLQHIYYH